MSGQENENCNDQAKVRSLLHLTFLSGWKNCGSAWFSSINDSGRVTWVWWVILLIRWRHHPPASQSISHLSRGRVFPCHVFLTFLLLSHLPFLLSSQSYHRYPFSFCILALTALQTFIFFWFVLLRAFWGPSSFLFNPFFSSAFWEYSPFEAWQLGSLMSMKQKRRGRRAGPLLR